MEVLRNNKLAENLLHLALAQGASDMHIEPDGQGVRVRIRVDGLLHTQDAAGTVNRILDVLPDRQHVCTQLADCLLGICCQRLLPRCDRAGRAAAFEVLVATPAMRNLIREGRTHQLQSYLQTGARYGMQTMEDAVKALQLRGIIA